MSDEGTPQPGAAGALLTGGTPAAGTPTPGAGAPDPGNSGGPAPFDLSTVMGDDGQFSENWQDTLTAARPEFADYSKTLANYKSPLDAFKALGETKALVGRKLDDVNTVLNPNPEDPTAMGLYRQALGIPDEATAEGYEFRPEGDLKDSVDQDLVADFAKQAHEMGLNKKQFAQLVEYQTGIMGKFGSDQEAQAEAADATAKADFMSASEQALGGKENLDKSLDLTVRMLRAGGMQDENIASEIAPHIHKMGPGFIKAMSELSKHVQEDRLPSSGTPASQGINAKEEYRAIIHDSKNPYHAIYHDPMHPDHNSVRDKVRGLIRTAG